MNAKDLFPAELAAASGRQRTLTDSTTPNEPLPGHGTEASEPTPPEASESRELLSQDNKAEALERYWFWDDSEYARMVCVKRWGEI